jgi:hypothetical protein
MMRRSTRGDREGLARNMVPTRISFDANARARNGQRERGPDVDKGGAEPIDRGITVQGRRGDAKTFGSLQTRIHLCGTQRSPNCLMPRILQRLALAAGRDKFLLISIISAGDAHQFCLIQRKAILISGRSEIVISSARFQNGGSNGLEGSKDCRSVGGHGNQHVRLRSAQVSLNGDDLPGSTSNFRFRTGAGARGA